jgi:hypothetical protein
LVLKQPVLPLTACLVTMRLLLRRIRLLVPVLTVTPHLLEAS